MRELDDAFWRNYRALTQYSPKRLRRTIPAQRSGSPADERWEAMLRAAYRHRRLRR